MVGSIVISDQSLTRVDGLSEPTRKHGGDVMGVPDKHVQYTQMSLMSRDHCLTPTLCSVNQKAFQSNANRPPFQQYDLHNE